MQQGGRTDAAINATLKYNKRAALGARNFFLLRLEALLQSILESQVDLHPPSFSWFLTD
jgi:hypothetical protein